MKHIYLLFVFLLAIQSNGWSEPKKFRPGALNGEFDSNLKGWSSINKNDTSKESGSFEISSEVKRNGDGSLMIELTKPTGRVGICTVDAILVQPGDKFRITFWAKVAEGSPKTYPGIIARVNWANSEGDLLPLPHIAFGEGDDNVILGAKALSNAKGKKTLPDDWFEAKGTVEIPPNATQMNIHIYANEIVAKYYVDDFTLEKVD